MKNYWTNLNESNNFESVPSNRDDDASAHDLNTLEIIADEKFSKSLSSRRDFLKFCGFGVSAALLASCESPVQYAIPLVLKPEEIIPGIANHYASTYFDGSQYCSILVKVRDGRPIKIEGNELSKITKGGTNAQVQAAVLNLYDSERLAYPTIKGEKSTWEEIHSQIIAHFKAAADKGDKIVIISSPIISPSVLKALTTFKEQYPTTEVIYYEPVSFSGTINANLNSFGKAVVPSYYFNKTNLIVSFSADFLGTWLSPVEFTKQYSEARALNKENPTMTRHIQLEAGFSLTGSNADKRIRVNPMEEGSLVLALYNKIAHKSGNPTLPELKTKVDISSIADELWENKGKSLVVAGSNDVDIQTLVNGINKFLDNYGNTIDLNTPYFTKKASEDDMERIVNEMNTGKVGVVLLNEVNPIYDYPYPKKIIAALKNVDFTGIIADRITETTLHVNYILPPDNFLESWGDFEPKKGSYSFSQPTISKLFDTYSFLDCLLKWTANEKTSYEYIKSNWEETLFPLQENYKDFDEFWAYTLQAGIFNLKVEKGKDDGKKTTQPPIPDINAALIKSARKITKKIYRGKIAIEMIPNIAIGDGTHANNPWLQELPDPVTKLTWDNVASVSIKYAQNNNIKTGQFITINDIKIPALVQPGQEDNTISIALGYGRKNVGKVGNNVGKNVYPFVQFVDGVKIYHTSTDKITISSEEYVLALNQTHDLMEGRSIIRETYIQQYHKNPASGNEEREEILKESTSLYPAAVFSGHHWGMSIDLNACTGCNSCVVACQAENNVAVVGKEQVINRRLMHWIRLDRYYAGDKENPEMVQMPIMCQQCNSAPCENVCPVAATMRSSEGINQMAYNRCIGTRYCMNNCPYKMRRFNWFQYAKNNEFDFNMNSDLGRMVLNPDVVVRSRGVVEKCSFCTQRIQEKKLTAKLEDRLLKDGEIQTACSQACSANAIVFGDLNDSESEVSKRFKNPRHYHLLEQLHTQPVVGYQTKVRNNNSEDTKKEIL